MLDEAIEYLKQLQLQVQVSFLSPMASCNIIIFFLKPFDATVFEECLFFPLKFSLKMNHETSQDMNYIIIQLTTNNI
jgi:hypothetical protein